MNAEHVVTSDLDRCNSLRWDAWWAETREDVIFRLLIFFSKVESLYQKTSRHSPLVLECGAKALSWNGVVWAGVFSSCIHRGHFWGQKHLDVFPLEQVFISLTPSHVPDTAAMGVLVLRQEAETQESQTRTVKDTVFSFFVLEERECQGTLLREKGLGWGHGAS